MFQNKRKKKVRVGLGKDGSNKTEELKGRWIVLQDWSSCSLACGGGSQTRHRYCIIPAGGDPCEGDAIENRPCNTEKCQNITEVEDNNEYLPAQIKVMRVSSKYQRYRKCEYKEEDLDIIREDIEGLKIKPRIPSRVVMNNRTISIFEASNYESLLKSFYLRELKEVKRYEKDPHRCLFISDKMKHFIMCVMPNDNQNPDTKIRNWIRDIRDFKENCRSRRKSITMTDPRINQFIHDLEEEKNAK